MRRSYLSARSRRAGYASAHRQNRGRRTAERGPSMNVQTSSQGVLLIFGAWDGSYAGLLRFLYLNKNVALKRKVLPASIIFTSILHLAFTWITGAPAHVFIFVVPGVALIAFLNIRNIKFCNSCGRTISGSNPFSPPKFRSKCGAPSELISRKS